jgi:hypothetical protein
MQSSQLIYTSERLINTENVARESSRLQGQDLSKYYSTNAYLDHYEDNKRKPRNRTILRLAFVEKLDLILAASEDGNVYLWGFDQEAVSILKNMKPLMKSSHHDGSKKIKSADQLNSLTSDSTNSISSASDTSDYNQSMNVGKKKSDANDSVTNRVAGFTLRKIFSEHTSCVTSLAIVDNPEIYPKVFLLTAGWDRYVL